MNCAFKIWYRIKDWPLPTRGQWVCHELEFAYGDKVRFNPEADIPTTSSAVQKQALRYLATVNVDASASNIRGKHNRRLRQSVLTFFISTKKCGPRGRGGAMLKAAYQNRALAQPIHSFIAVCEICKEF